MATESDPFAPTLTTNRMDDPLDASVRLEWQGYGVTMYRSPNDGRMIFTITPDLDSSASVDDQLAVDIEDIADERVFG